MSRPPKIIHALWSLIGLAGLAFLLRRPRTGIALGAAAHGLLSFACTRRNSPIFVPWIQRFSTTQREVWLTIDDGPTQDTDAFLGVLAKFGAKASFFAIGQRVHEFPDAARRIVAAGHSIENHTQNHLRFFFWTLPACIIRSEVTRANRIIKRVTGVSPRYFRAPVGMSTPSLHRILSANWLRPVGWSADGWDGAPGRNLEAAVEEILRRLEPGVIILFHQGGRPDRVAALEDLLTKIYRRGYRCILPSHDAF